MSLAMESSEEEFSVTTEEEHRELKFIGMIEWQKGTMTQSFTGTENLRSLEPESRP
uniref:Uncharacterized protein n=1 Tax=Moniliophthora roreri TaxID=221103 RepID=A0A0W0FXB6_MONRR